MTSCDDGLDAGIIRDALDETTAATVDTLDVLNVVDSTNDRLRDRGPPPFGRISVLLAEFQTSGRGRRGRTWLSPAGAGICLSVACTFEAQPPGFAALGLAAGVAVRQGLEIAGIPGLGLKWPNDVIAGERKLAGVLVDSTSVAGGATLAVIGIGINVAVTPVLPDEITAGSDLPPVSVAELLPGDRPSRNEIVARVICALRAVLEDFAAAGFAAVTADWRRHDVLAGRRVAISNGAHLREGVARGIDDSGALIVESQGGLVTLTAGNVSVRPVA